MERNGQTQLQKVKASSEEKGARLFFAVSVARGSEQLARRIVGRLASRAQENVESETPLLRRRALARPSGYLLSFIFLVVLPSIVSMVYLGFIASDQYVAEARFAVKATQLDLGRDKLLSTLSALGSGAIPSLAGQDPYIVTSYIRSRAIIEDLSKELDLREIFRRPEADFWARLKRDASAEELVKYWNGMVAAYVDGPSAIVTVETRAFRPGDSLAVSWAIIKASEKLVNDVSARARNDQMRRAEEEVRRYEIAVRQSLLELRKYRDAEGFIDPASAATSTSQLLMQAMSEEIQLQNEVFVASRAMSPDAPTLQTLKVRLEGVDRQVQQLKSKLAGNSPEGRTVAASLAKFEELELKRIFAEKLYTMAQDALERARLRAEQQNLYLSVFVPPSLPQDAIYPERFGYSLVIPIGLLVLWGIMALIAAAVEDHRG
jgi:capsular polysaccharide transport system permease protein